MKIPDYLHLHISDYLHFQIPDFHCSLSLSRTMGCQNTARAVFSLCLTLILFSYFSLSITLQYHFYIASQEGTIYFQNSFTCSNTTFGKFSWMNAKCALFATESHNGGRKIPSIWKIGCRINIPAKKERSPGVNNQTHTSQYCPLTRSPLETNAAQQSCNTIPTGNWVRIPDYVTATWNQSLKNQPGKY